jgi:hypothetical protein
MSGEISKTEFAKLAGVSPGRVSQYLRDGVIGLAALAGNGRNARIKADLALAMVRDSMDQTRSATNLALPDSSTSSLIANRARKEGFQADLLELRLAHGRCELQEATAAALVALGTAVKRAHRDIPFWVDEIVGAWKTGGFPAAHAIMRSKDDELLNSIANMILAFQGGRDDDGG